MAEALVIVDFQNDFTPGGALAVPEGDQIAEHVNELAADPRFELVVATRDWHPADHGSFDQEGGPWPVHCVQDSEGAQLHPALDHANLDVIVDKGQNPATEGYSGFDETGLERLLRERGIDRLLRQEHRARRAPPWVRGDRGHGRRPRRGAAARRLPAGPRGGAKRRRDRGLRCGIASTRRCGTGTG